MSRSYQEYKPSPRNISSARSIASSPGNLNTSYTGLRPHTRIPPSVTPFSNREPVEHSQHSMKDDDSIESMTFPENPNSGNSSKSSFPLTIPSIPFEIEEIIPWLCKHFHSTIKKDEAFLKNILVTHMGIRNVEDLYCFKSYLPEQYLLHLGPELYDPNCSFLRELSILIEFMHNEFERDGLSLEWKWNNYLDLRYHRKKEMDSFPTSKFLNMIQKHRLKKFGSPPSYTPVSPAVATPYISQSSRSYHTIAPAILDPYGSDFDPDPSNKKGSQKSASDQPDYFSYHSSHKQDTLSKHSIGRKHKENDGSNSSNSQRRTTIYHRYESAPKARAALSLKVEWDGTRTKFEPYQRLIEGHLLQVGAGYLIDPAFLEQYEQLGVEYLYSDDFWIKYSIPVKQAQYDRKYLYGILVSSNRNCNTQAILKYQKSQDGILTWIAFKLKYAHDGSKELKIEKLEEAITKPFHSKYPGGMETYIDTFQATMEKIDALDPDSFNDMRKKRTLLKNVRHVPQLAHLVQKCRDDITMTFEDTAAYLRSNSILIDYLGENNNSGRNSTMLKVESHPQDSSSTINRVATKEKDLDYKSVMHLVKDMIHETSHHHVLNALSSQTLRQSLRIPDQLWRKMEPKLRKQVEDIKNQIIAESKSEIPKPSSETAQDRFSRSNNGSDHGKRTDSLPPQYPSKANHVTNEEDAGSEGSFTDDDSFHVFMVKCHTEDIEVRAHIELAEQCKDPEKVYAISDGGADSCILGKHAHVLHETGRYATLVGYDPKTTRSKRIPIVSAYLKVMEPKSGFPIFLKVNEAPYHSENPITLLSEYQIRDYGYVIDSVATKHKKSQSEWGTQRFELSDLIHIPFEDRGGMMGFEILPITDSDFLDGGVPKYDVFEITGPKQWIPV